MLIRVSLSTRFFEQPIVIISIVFFFITTLVCLFVHLEKRIHKLTLVEELQIFHLLSQTNVLHRHLELVANTDHHSSLGCSVELGDGKRCYLSDSRKLFSLLKGVLSSTTVKHEHNLIGSLGQHLLHHVLNLLQLVHQSHLVVQSSGSVNEHHIGTICLGAAQPVESHRCRL